MAQNIDKLNSGTSVEREKSGGGFLKILLIILLLLVLLASGAAVALNLFGIRNTLGHMLIVPSDDEITFEQQLKDQEAQLVEQQDALDLRSEELDKREKDLQRQQLLLEQAQLALESLKVQPDSPLMERAARLAGIYELMDTATVAKILEAMDDNEEIVRILQNMSDETVAAILGSMKKDRAAEISRVLMGVL